MIQTIFDVVDITAKKFNLQESYTHDLLYENSDRFVMLYGINKITNQEEEYLLYDCSKTNDEFDFVKYQAAENKKSVFTIPIMIFKSWSDERKKMNEAKNQLQESNKRKILNEFFEKKISIYTDLEESLSLKLTEQGVNYLEYKIEYVTDNNGISKENISGYIYNMSIHELRKIFNVTGRDLFRLNVRNGLEDNIIGKKIKNDFKDYMTVYIFTELNNKLSNQNKNDKEEYLENFKNEFLIDDEKINTRKAEKFWFYHNGITIFSYDNKEIIRSGAQIKINPKKVSVINGAQTLTNFYIGNEELKYALKNLSKNIGSEDFRKKAEDILNNAIDSVEKNIILKTIFINGTEEGVRTITSGLNTQIPIEETGIIANSEQVKIINSILNKNNMIILKDGERAAVGTGFSVRDFAKQYLIIKNKPGKSKNLNVKDINKMIEKAQNEIEKHEKEYIQKLETIFAIDEWWMNNRKISENKSYSALESYGKNYFQSYILMNIEKNEELEVEKLDYYYETFLKEFINLTDKELKVGDFQKDELFNLYKKNYEENNSNKETETERDGQLNLEELKKYIIENKVDNYTIKSLILKYLNENEITLPNFRIISMFNNNPMEAFAFSNTTFNELFYGEDYEKKEYKTYSNSKFKKEINKINPAFIIYWTNRTRNDIKKIRYIREFTFKNFDKNAEKVYKKTVEVFKLGDELKFPKSSDNLGFHIRSKAINKQDSFEFSNGDIITKKTFWANKDTVKQIVEGILIEN